MEMNRDVPDLYSGGTQFEFLRGNAVIFTWNRSQPLPSSNGNVTDKIDNTDGLRHISQSVLSTPSSGIVIITTIVEEIPVQN
jgi:hypothetical protein